jgi:2,3-bisphosphoglycerate-independent phosphoglycerate mutase
MVGHTGDLEAAIAAMQCIDECIGQVQETVIEAGGIVLVKYTRSGASLADGRLADVAPTLIDLMAWHGLLK